MFSLRGCSSYMTVHSRLSCSSGVFLPVHDQMSFSVCRTSFSSATVQHWSTWDHSTTMQTEPHTPLDEGLGRLGATPGDSMDFQRMKTTVPTPFISPLWVWLAWAGGSGHRHHWIRPLPGLCIARLLTLQCDDRLPQALVFCI